MKVDEVADFLIKEGVRPRFFAINTVVADDAVVLYQEGTARMVSPTLTSAGSAVISMPFLRTVA